MPKPHPIIHLPKLADHERLARGLHRLGYRYGHAMETEDEMWQRWASHGVAHTYPYTLDGFYMSRAVSVSGRLCGHTKVNSVSHFLDYVRRHHAKS